MNDAAFEKYYNNYLEDRKVIVTQIEYNNAQLEEMNRHSSESEKAEYVKLVLNRKIVEAQSALEKFDIEKCKEKYGGTKFLDVHLKICNTNIKSINAKVFELMEILQHPSLVDNVLTAEYKKLYNDIKYEYENYIYVQTTNLKNRDASMASEKKYQENRKKITPLVELSQVQQKRLLNTRVTEKFGNLSVNAENLPSVKKCIRSVETPVDKYNFLSACRRFEVENELVQLETTEALNVLDRYIMINIPEGTNPREENYNKGDPVVLKELYNLMELIIDDKYFTSSEKFNRVVAFFLGSAKDYAYNLFYKLLTSPLTRIFEKIEACKFLYYSNDEKYIPDIEKYTLELIEDDTIDDRVRYEAIACYISNLGLKSKYLDETLPSTGLDVQLVIDLFKVFINQKVHPDMLILAYTFLLEQEVDDSIKPSIEVKLLELANTLEFPGVDKEKAIRIRADAADTLWRLGTIHNEDGGRIITEIGNMENTSELTSTVYTNTENIHLVNEKMTEYVEQLYISVKQKFTSIDAVLTDIEIYCDKAKLSLDNISKVRRSLDRILLDCSTFTKYKLTMSTILMTIYNKIYSMPKKSHVIARLIEELIDMADTCASGHAKRIVNTMIGFDTELEGVMDIELQLDANIKARIGAAMKSLPNIDEVMDASVSDDRTIYVEAVKNIYNTIVDELVVEFVDAGFMSRSKFDTVAQSILEKL